MPEQVEIAAYYVVVRGADQHRQTRRRLDGPDPASTPSRATITTCCTSRSATTGAAAPTLARGTGLLGLKDRVEALGGRIILDSPPEAGTTLRLELPLTDANTGGIFR